MDWFLIVSVVSPIVTAIIVWWLTNRNRSQVEKINREKKLEMEDYYKNVLIDERNVWAIQRETYEKTIEDRNKRIAELEIGQSELAELKNRVTKVEKKNGH